MVTIIGDGPVPYRHLSSQVAPRLPRRGVGDCSPVETTASFERQGGAARRDQRGRHAYPLYSRAFTVALAAS